MLVERSSKQAKSHNQSVKSLTKDVIAAESLNVQGETGTFEQKKAKRNLLNALYLVDLFRKKVFCWKYLKTGRTLEGSIINACPFLTVL